MRASLLIIAALVVTPLSASAQVVVGRVIDVDTRRPIAAARIEVIDTANAVRGTTVSDSLGIFRASMTPARYRFTVTHIGYQTTSTGLITIQPQREIQVQIPMGVRPLEVAPIVVVAERRLMPARLDQFYDRKNRIEKFGGGRFVTRAEMDSTFLPLATQYIAREGVRLSGNAARNPVAYGYSQCALWVYLDGALQGRSIPTVSADDLEGIEIYKSSLEIPIEYRDINNDCGAILMWSRSADGTGKSFWRAILIGGAVFGLGAFFFL